MMINYGKFHSQHSPFSEKKGCLIGLGLPTNDGCESRFGHANSC